MKIFEENGWIRLQLMDMTTKKCYLIFTSLNNIIMS